MLCFNHVSSGNHCLFTDIKVIKLFFLLISYFYNRKGLFEKPVNFIHLNLSIALLLALILFVGGVETAVNIPVR